MRRKRKHISLKTKLAAALACLMPQVMRDFLRTDRVGPDTIIRCFEFDHIVLHAHDGSDEWWNLDPKFKAPHREKSRRDTAIVAKVKRLQTKMVGTVRVTRYLVRPEQPVTMDAIAEAARPKRKIPSRPFPKRARKPRRR